jgi:hypothetical protein
MGKRPSWPVSVAEVGPVTMGTIAWRCGGQLSVTVLVKATFRLAAGRPMSVTIPEPVLDKDEPSGALLSSPRAPADTAPQLRKADVMLFGSGYAPLTAGSARSTTTTEITVRLAMGRDDTVLLDKALRLVGNRQGDNPPTPFTRLPISYERAFGGPDVPNNPIGVGIARHRGAQPNVLSPGGTSETIAGFGPIPLFFLSRDKLLGSHSRKLLRQAIAEIPVDFDWDYFQSAPDDQRIATLQGNEWLELTGVSPTHHHLRTWLPSARAVTRVYGQEHSNVPDSVPLCADSLLIEPDDNRCSLVWRGSFPLADPQLVEKLVIAGGLELPGRPVRWPADWERALAMSQPRATQAGAEPGKNDPTATVVYDPQDEPPTDVYEPTRRTTVQPNADLPKPGDDTFMIDSAELFDSADHPGELEVLAAGSAPGDPVADAAAEMDSQDEDLVTHVLGSELSAEITAGAARTGAPGSGDVDPKPDDQ